MQARRITLRDFRNYARAEVGLEKGLTVLQGPVGAGKTNLLEAIYFGCIGRSFRTSNDRELIRFGASSTYVAVETTTAGSDHVLEAGLELLAPRFSARAGELGLTAAASISYEPRSSADSAEA